MSSRQSEIYNTAIRLLSRREHSRRELQQKLRHKYPQASTSDIQMVLDELQNKDYQSEHRYAAALIRSKIERHYGWQYIQQNLAQQGIADDIVQYALSEINPDWGALAQAAYDKQYAEMPPQDFAEQQKRKAYLMRKGFDFDQINRVKCNQ